MLLDAPDCWKALGRRYDKEAAIFRNRYRTLWPEALHLAQPSIDLATKVPVERVVARPELILESVVAKEWDADWIAVHCPALPHDPDVKIEGTGSMREGKDDLALDRDPMVVDLAVECFAQGDGVLV